MRITSSVRAAASGVGAIMAVLAVPSSLSAGTIATFADPAPDGSMHLFEINLVTDIVSGGWPDSRTGLTLQVPWTGMNYTDAFFEMEDLEYTGGISGGISGAGTIQFLRDGDIPGTVDPLLQISFDSAQLTLQGLAGDNIYFFHADNNVVITVWETTGPVALTEEASFSFGFANQAPLPCGEGFTATASFDSSAIPEPASVAGLLAGTTVLGFSVRVRRG